MGGTKWRERDQGIIAVSKKEFDQETEIDQER